MRKCELCKSTARMYCESDQASLCWDCDARVHTANFIVAKHLRNLLCHACQSPTPWTASGRHLGPTISLCESCSNGSRRNINRDRDIPPNGNAEEHGDEGEDKDEEEEEEIRIHGNDEDDDDADYQVVPLSSTSLPPPVASSSSSSEESFNGLSRGRSAVSSSSFRFSRNGIEQPQDQSTRRWAHGD